MGLLLPRASEHDKELLRTRPNFPEIQGFLIAQGFVQKVGYPLRRKHALVAEPADAQA
ncbi:MAG: hypothetical protein AB7T14_04670 [Candidatus Methylacidiphilaceae bacterium]